MAISFHLDENVSHAVARGLRRRHIDVTTVAESGMQGDSDEEQLRLATTDGRVLVTHDPDLLVLAQGGQEHAGIAYCDQERRSVGQIVRELLRLWQTYEQGDMTNRVEFI